MKLSAALDRVWGLAQKHAITEHDKEAVDIVADYFQNYLLDKVEEEEEEGEWLSVDTDDLPDIVYPDRESNCQYGDKG